MGFKLKSVLKKVAKGLGGATVGLVTGGPVGMLAGAVSSVAKKGGFQLKDVISSGLTAGAASGILTGTGFVGKTLVPAAQSLYQQGKTWVEGPSGGLLTGAQSVLNNPGSPPAGDPSASSSSSAWDLFTGAVTAPPAAPKPAPGFLDTLTPAQKAVGGGALLWGLSLLFKRHP